MNIEQIKHDLNNGVIVCRTTIVQLVDLALRQQAALAEFLENPCTHEVYVEKAFQQACDHCDVVAGHEDHCLVVLAESLIAEGRSNYGDHI